MTRSWTPTGTALVDRARRLPHHHRSAVHPCTAPPSCSVGRRAPTARCPSAPWPFWYAGVIELVVGLLVMLGLFARLAALLGASEMAFAYFHPASAKSILAHPEWRRTGRVVLFRLLLIAFGGAERLRGQQVAFTALAAAHRVGSPRKAGVSSDQGRPDHPPVARLARRLRPAVAAIVLVRALSRSHTQHEGNPVKIITVIASRSPPRL